MCWSKHEHLQFAGLQGASQFLLLYTLLMFSSASTSSLGSIDEFCEAVAHGDIPGLKHAAARAAVFAAKDIFFWFAAHLLQNLVHFLFFSLECWLICMACSRSQSCSGFSGGGMTSTTIIVMPAITATPAMARGMTDVGSSGSGEWGCLLECTY
jgi:hypothetical protein